VFNAIQIEKTESGQTARLTQIDQSQLPDADVLVQIDYSTLYYQDGLAKTGK
jgi:acrylyl-CoA reductase (NADPH)